MKPTKFEIAIALIDKKNSEDINKYQAMDWIFQRNYCIRNACRKKLLQFYPMHQEAF